MMVDELELLKKDWQKQEGTLPHYTKEELYPMLLKKSSSVVKWILIVSIIEFAFWILISFIPEFRDANNEFENKADTALVNNVLLVINYIALGYFAVCFYLNYKRIKATDNAKALMKNILKARRTVKQYIWFNVSFIFIGAFIAFGVAYSHNPNAFKMSNPVLLFVTLLVVVGIIVGILLLIYRLIYGRLTRRLKSNYEQLKKLEI